MDPVITVDEVTKQFRDGTTALDRLSLTLPPGIIYSLARGTVCAVKR